jgi:hypothetical protein
MGTEYYHNIQLSQELEEAAARVQQEVRASLRSLASHLQHLIH